LCELLSRSVLCALYMLGTYLRFHRAKINTCTLDELVRINDDLVPRTCLFYGQLFVDQCAEIFTITTLFAQNLCRSVWSVAGTEFLSAEFFRSGAWYGTVVAAFLVQLCVEIPVDSLAIYCSHRVAPVDLIYTFRKHSRHWAIKLFCFGVMQWSSFAFWPECHSCHMPYNCLLFTECLRDGSVLANGTNLCQLDFQHINSHVAATLLELNGHVSKTDLGCVARSGEPYVWCYS